MPSRRHYVSLKEDCPNWRSLSYRRTQYLL
nr:MAG TPA: hypothetical protein [Caudoviricetes sp.]